MDVSVQAQLDVQAQLARYLANYGISPTDTLCFACSENGVKVFAATNAGLIIVPEHDLVWKIDEAKSGTAKQRDGHPEVRMLDTPNGEEKTRVPNDSTVTILQEAGDDWKVRWKTVEGWAKAYNFKEVQRRDKMRMPGADLAVFKCPAARQLAWLHRIFSSKPWCVCMWLTPPDGPKKGAPSAKERANLTSVASRHVAALGHPPWIKKGDANPEDPPTCSMRIDGELVACPDWTPLMGSLKDPDSPSGRIISESGDLTLYNHSLDVGIAQVNHMMERHYEKQNQGYRVRMYSCRFVNSSREKRQAATEMTVKCIPDASFFEKRQHLPDIHISSSLLVDEMSPGWTVGEMAADDADSLCLTATFYKDGRSITVQAFHRLVKEEGGGNLQLYPSKDGLVKCEKCDPPRGKGVAFTFVFAGPKRNTGYTVEKVVTFQDSAAAAVPFSPLSRSNSRVQATANSNFSGAPDVLLSEIEEEHRSEWRMKWDQADIEIWGNRTAMKCQRALRLYRFHQVSRGLPMNDPNISPEIPDLVNYLFEESWRALFLKAGGCDEHEIRGKADYASRIVSSRLKLPDSRPHSLFGLIISIVPNVPPACRMLRFNAAMNKQWYRFTLTPGKVQILVQGPILHGGPQITEPFNITDQAKLKKVSFSVSGMEGDNIVQVSPSPWHEVQVQHSLTDLGRPDGSTGGFYSLMRRTRFMRQEVLRRLCIMYESEGVWQYKDDDSRWQPFVPADVQSLNEVRASGKDVISLNMAGDSNPCKVSFQAKMLKLQNGKVRQIRIVFRDAGDYCDPTLLEPLRNALTALASVPKPLGPDGRTVDDSDLHVLEADATTRASVKLSYEKNELSRDIAFLSGGCVSYKGRLVDDSKSEAREMQLEEAKKEVRKMSEEVRWLEVGEEGLGFTFRKKIDEVEENDIVEVDFKRTWNLKDRSDGSDNDDWTSVRFFKDGEDAIWAMLKFDHEKHRMALLETANISSLTSSTAESFSPHPRREDDEIPCWVKSCWDDIVEETIITLEKAVADAIEPDAVLRERANSRNMIGSDSNNDSHRHMLESPTVSQNKRFRNFITDRDGTTNNYCDRYASSVQSAYNAAFLTHFKRCCTENAVYITSAPLGGHPTAEGLLELSVAPRTLFIYAGSKGREYFDHFTQRVIEAEKLEQEDRERIEELHRRLCQLCSVPGNSKFLGIGSGLQRKFGEVAMARNDPASTVPESESKRFMLEVRRVKEELDPEGTKLDLHDTGTDMEIYPRVPGGRPSFDKGSGVRCLDRKLGLLIGTGPNLVCGDTPADVDMVEAVLRLMCQPRLDHVVDEWLKEIDRELNPPLDVETQPVQVNASEADASLPSGPEEEEEAKAREEEAERAEEEIREAQRAAKRLAVVFVISLKEHRKNPKFAKKLQKICEKSGSHCCIVPSPDVLVGALATYATKVSGRRVTDPEPIQPVQDTEELRNTSSSNPMDP